MNIYLGRVDVHIVGNVLDLNSTYIYYIIIICNVYIGSLYSVCTRSIIFRKKCVYSARVKERNANTNLINVFLMTTLWCHMYICILIAY